MWVLVGFVTLGCKPTKTSDMKTNRIPNVLMAFLLTGMLFGCSKEQQQENCLVGTWSNNGNCPVATRYTFNGNGTGQVLQDNCPNTCTNGTEWRVRSNFDYEVTSAGLTITFTEMYSCDSALQNVPNTPYTVTFNCEDDIFVYGNATYQRQ